MEILTLAIIQAKGVSKLAAVLGVNQSTVSNWKRRGLPLPWQVALEAKYRRHATRIGKATVKATLKKNYVKKPSITKVTA